MKTKEETNQEILEEASVGNTEFSEIRVRHTDSVHPKDCHCPVCEPLKFEEAIGEIKENELKEVLDLYDETKL